MQHSFDFEVEAITVNAAKIPVTLKGIRLHAEAEYSSEEMATEGSIVNQIIDQLADKFGWLKPLIEKEINIQIKNHEMLSKDLEKQISEGTCRAYGPNGWSVRTSDLHDSKPSKCDKKH